MTQWTHLVITNLETDEYYNISDDYDDPNHRFDFRVDSANNVLSLYVWFEGDLVAQVVRALPRQFEIEAQQ